MNTKSDRPQESVYRASHTLNTGSEIEQSDVDLPMDEILAELLAENQLLTHKVVACGVIADHPDATLGDRHPYSTEWNSQQADRVRGLRRRHEEALAVIEKLARFAEAYEPRTRNTEVEQHDALKRARILLTNPRDAIPKTLTEFCGLPPTALGDHIANASAEPRP